MVAPIVTQWTYRRNPELGILRKRGNAMAGVKGVYNYISDDGATYRVKLDASNATAVGNAAATVSAHLPGGYRPRYILATHPTSGRERKLVVCDPANALFVGGTSTVSVEEFTSSAHSTTAAHAVLSRVGEKRYNR
jgi:hypothetical protein